MKFMTYVLSIVLLPQFAQSQEFPELFQAGTSELSMEDRRLALGVVDAARNMAALGDLEVASIMKATTMERDDAKRSYSQVIPNVPVSIEVAREVHEGIGAFFESNLEVQAALNDGGIVEEAFVLAQELGSSSLYSDFTPEKKDQFIRGLIIVNSQLVMQSKALTGESLDGVDKDCWWPFCP